VSLGEIVEQVLAITRPRWKDQAEAVGVQFTVQTALADTPPVLGHAAELREALTNLLFNALDAMPQGGTITIATRQVSGPVIDETRAHDPGTERVREWVEVSVTDTGVGMPPAVRARLFEPFFTTKGVRGTGLGLSMVHGIVSRHEGEVTVQSAEGQGTTITLRMPVARAAVEVVPSPTAQIPPSPARSTSSSSTTSRSSPRCLVSSWASWATRRPSRPAARRASRASRQRASTWS
jgi:signal transduction histidine kinase